MKVINLIMITKLIYLPMFTLCISTIAAKSQTTYTLQQCKQMAVNNNIKMKNARLSIEQSKEQEKEAFTKYFPSISTSGNYFRSSDYLIKDKIKMGVNEQQQLGLDPSVLSSLSTSYTLKAINHGALVNLIAMQPIYAGGQIITPQKLAKLQTQVRTLQL